MTLYEHLQIYLAGRPINISGRFVKFKESQLNVRYKVLSDVPDYGHDDLHKKYCWRIEISSLGFIPVEVLEFTDEDLQDAIDFMLEIKKEIDP